MSKNTRHSTDLSRTDLVRMVARLRGALLEHVKGDAAVDRLLEETAFDVADLDDDGDSLDPVMREQDPGETLRAVLFHLTQMSRDSIDDGRRLFHLINLEDAVAALLAKLWRDSASSPRLRRGFVDGMPAFIPVFDVCSRLVGAKQPKPEGAIRSNTLTRSDMLQMIHTLRACLTGQMGDSDGVHKEVLAKTDVEVAEFGLPEVRIRVLLRRVFERLTHHEEDFRKHELGAATAALNLIRNATASKERP